MKKLVLLVVAVLALAQMAQATLFRVDFQPTSGWGEYSVPNGTVEPNAAAADSVFGSVGGNYWNIATLAGWGYITTNPSFTGLKDTATGIASGVSLSLSGTVSAAGQNGVTVGGTHPGWDYLVLLNGSTSDSLGYTVSGLLPNAPVKLYLYSAGNTGNRGYGFTIAGDPTTYSVPSYGATGLLVTGTTDGSGQLSGTFIRAFTETDIAGLQIYQAAAIPEPSTWALVSLALVPLFFRRSRKSC